MYFLQNDIDIVLRRTGLVERYCKCEMDRGFIRSAEALLNSGSFLRAKVFLATGNQPVTIKGMAFVPEIKRSQSMSNLSESKQSSFISVSRSTRRTADDLLSF